MAETETTPTPATPAAASDVEPDAEFTLVLKEARKFWHTDEGAEVLANIIHSRTACEVELKVDLK